MNGEREDDEDPDGPRERKKERARGDSAQDAPPQEGEEPDRQEEEDGLAVDELEEDRARVREDEGERGVGRPGPFRLLDLPVEQEERREREGVREDEPGQEVVPEREEGEGPDRDRPEGKEGARPLARAVPVLAQVDVVLRVPRLEPGPCRDRLVLGPVGVDLVVAGAEEAGQEERARGHERERDRLEEEDRETEPDDPPRRARTARALHAIVGDAFLAPRLRHGPPFPGNQHTVVRAALAH